MICVEFGGKNANRMSCSSHSLKIPTFKWLDELSPITTLGPSSLVAHGMTTFLNQSSKTEASNHPDLVLLNLASGGPPMHHADYKCSDFYTV